jgi:hypothetical protein
VQSKREKESKQKNGKRHVKINNWYPSARGFREIKLFCFFFLPVPEFLSYSISTLKKFVSVKCQLGLEWKLIGFGLDYEDLIGTPADMQREKTQQDKIKNSRVQTILGGGTVQKFLKKKSFRIFLSCYSRKWKLFWLALSLLLCTPGRGRLF